MIGYKTSWENIPSEKTHPPGKHETSVLASKREIENWTVSYNIKVIIWATGSV